MSEATKWFYKTRQWKKCSKSYMQSQHYICEECGGIARICHHKTWLNADNVHDPNITLNWDNLEAVCIDCHNRIHRNRHVIAKGLRFNQGGELEKINTPHAEPLGKH